MRASSLLMLSERLGEMANLVVLIGGGGKHYAYKGHDHGYGDHHKHYGSYGKYRRYGYSGWYGLPCISYGYGSGCGWLYRNAVNTGSSYWWNRYYECIGYY